VALARRPSQTRTDSSVSWLPEFLWIMAGLVGLRTSQITYRDGSQKVWEFPRMEKMGIIEKMFKEGYRRWGNDCVCDKDQSYLWPDAARYIARANAHPGNPPVSVSIIRHWSWIDPPNVALKKPLRTADDGQETLTTCPISLEELE
jgi:hypothetical protein